jgi:hypothetical protein
MKILVYFGVWSMKTQNIFKSKSINQIKYADFIEFLDEYVSKKNQNELDRFQERNGPRNPYDKQPKLLFRYETAVIFATS